MSLLFLTPTGQCSSCLHPRGRSLLFLRCLQGGCGTILAVNGRHGGRFWLECSVFSGWDEGSGMLQQEFQAGFAPEGCFPNF